MTGSPADRPEAARLEAERLAGGLPALLVQAQRIAATVEMGIHGRRRVGQGEAFWQFRYRQDTDASTAIDWRRSAKSDSLYVRDTEWEAAQSVWIWVDPSAGMDYRSGTAPCTKGARALVLGLALATLLLRAHERVVPFVGDARAVRGPGALETLAQYWGQAPDGLPDRPLPRFGRVILISDFLAPPEAIQNAVTRQAGRHVTGHMLQIADPAEEDMPFEGRTLFEGLGGAAQSLLVGRAESLRTPYRRRYRAHREALQTLARRMGWQFLSHRTDHSAQTPVLAVHQALADHSDRRGPFSGRARS